MQFAYQEGLAPAIPYLWIGRLLLEITFRLVFADSARSPGLYRSRLEVQVIPKFFGLGPTHWNFRSLEILHL